MMRSASCLPACALCVVLLCVWGPARADDAALVSHYPTKRIYVTFSALSAVRNFTSTARSLSDLKKRHDPQAVALLKEFIDIHVTISWVSSAAFLLVDFGSKVAYFKMDNIAGNAELLDARWSTKAAEVAAVLDDVLGQEQYYADAVDKIKTNQISLASALAELKDIAASDAVPVKYKAQIAFTIKAKWETDPVTQKQFRELGEPEKRSISPILFDLDKSEIVEAGKPNPSAFAVRVFDEKVNRMTAQ